MPILSRLNKTTINFTSWIPFSISSVPFLVFTPSCKTKALLAVALNSCSVCSDPALIRTRWCTDLPSLSLGICPQARFEGVTKRQLIYLPTKESHLTFTPAQIKSPLGWNYILIWYNNKFLLLPHTRLVSEIKWCVLARWGREDAGLMVLHQRAVETCRWWKPALFRTLAEGSAMQNNVHARLWKTLQGSLFSSFRLS